jgi:sugar/nucleoside kinase (ribokinase family)
VLKGLANLSGGRLRCCFNGMVGCDATAAAYRQMLQQQGVEPCLLVSVVCMPHYAVWRLLLLCACTTVCLKGAAEGATAVWPRGEPFHRARTPRRTTHHNHAQEAREGPTASCLCFVTPDGQRTMRTCLGASARLQSAAQLPAGWCSGAALLHCEGYCLYRPQLAREAMAAAKAAGALVSLDLASFECVQSCGAALLGLLRGGLIDLVFANEDEALALLEVVAPAAAAVAAEAPAAAEAGAAEAPAAAAAAPAAAAPAAAAAAKVAAAQRFVLQHAQVCVVSLGARGCVARARDGRLGVAPAGGVQVVDTIGAGDYFTSGFLYAHLMGCGLAACARVGCMAGSEAVQVKGSILSEAAWQGLRARVDAVMAEGQQGQAGPVAQAQATRPAAAAARRSPASPKRDGGAAAASDCTRVLTAA